MATSTNRKGAGGALMDEYEKAVAALKACIAGITNEELIKIVDTATQDEHCRSVQTVLTHVVYAGYGYATSVHNAMGGHAERAAKAFHPDVAHYMADLDRMIAYTDRVMETVPDSALEEPDESEKIQSTWGQRYDIEQMMEHAIVHILRHRRQIEGFKLLLER